jgi:hypothetical protein
MRSQKRRKIFAVVVTVAAALAPVSASWAADANILLDEFAKLDGAYVPALALTKMGTLEASGKALGRLKRDWRGFQAQFAGAMPQDGQWRTDFRRVSVAIKEADTHLQAGHQAEAHESLEAIREILLTARRRHDLDYYLDYLTEFHDTMEVIVLAVKDAQPADLQASTIESMRGLTDKAIEQWERVKVAPFSAKRFRFSEAKNAQRQQLLKAETLALQQLKAALASGDKAQIISTGKAIKPVFAKSFMLFGDFPQPIGNK